jgi:tape measure domain-containing protein
MAIKAAELVVEVGADTKNAEQGLDSINSKVEGVAKGLATQGLTLSAAFTAPIAAITKLGFEYLNVKEQATIAFTSMLGDGQKAKAFLDDLQAFAAKTPFEFPDLIKSAQMMRAMGIAAQDVIPTLTSVGNAAAATGRGKEAVEGITLALTQMFAKGKVSAQEMNQLAERGVPGWRYLADAIGTSIPEAMKKAEKGSIDAGTAIKALTEGMNKDFAGMMDQQSKSIAGMMSTLEDSARMMVGEILQPVFDQLSSILQEFTKPGGYLDSFMNAWRNLSPEVKNSILVLAGVLAIAGPVALAIAGIVTVVSALISPIGLVIAIVAALAVAFTTNLGGIRDKALDVFNELKKLYDSGASALSTFGSIVSSTWEIIKAIFAHTVGQIIDTVRVFLKILNGDWAGAWEVVKESAAESLEYLSTIFSNLGNILAGIWDLIIAGVTGARNLITDAISTGHHSSLRKRLNFSRPCLGGLLASFKTYRVKFITSSG